jgi:Ser/Thr protein kinase RdoA (MazF antagonist)
MATEVEFATWAPTIDLPIVSLSPRVSGSQPIVTDGAVATIWSLGEPIPAHQVDMLWLGRTLAFLHGAETRPRLPAWSVQATIQRRRVELAASGTVSAALIADLDRAATRILATADALLSALPTVVLHGDAFPDNVVTGASGLMLVDFELAQFGPAVYDLAPVSVLNRRFGFPDAAVAELLHGYGPVDPAALEAAIELTELAVTCGAIGTYASRHDVFRDELVVRTRSLLNGGDEMWTPHHQLLDRVGGNAS